MSPRAGAAALLAGLAVGLSGCGGAQDAWSDMTRGKPTYDLPVANGADRSEPMVRRMGYPVPDRAWTRESASEREPWTNPPGR